MVIECAVVRSSLCRETVGRIVMGKSQVIVSTNELLSVCKTVALDRVEVGGAKSSGWVELFDDFLFTTNSKCTCHLTATRGEKYITCYRNSLSIYIVHSWVAFV